MNEEEVSMLDEEERYIIVKAMQCLHNLRYISDIAIISQKNSELLEMLIEEVVKVRETMNGQ